jgi:hypothetical protein
MGVTRDFIAELDAAVAGLCACGCNVAIDAASPSAWFASEACSARWHVRRDPTAAQPLHRLGEMLREVFAELAGAVAELTGAVAAFFKQLAEDFRSFVAAVEPYRDGLPGDGHAPQRRLRPRARIDPCTGFSARPLGRPTFRPRY